MSMERHVILSTRRRSLEAREAACPHNLPSVRAISVHLDLSRRRKVKTKAKRPLAFGIGGGPQSPHPPLAVLCAHSPKSRQIGHWSRPGDLCPWTVPLGLEP